MKHGLLVSMAVGDAFGAGFEFRPAEFIKAHNDLTTYYPHQLGRGKHVPGMYTDDTQMSIALAEFMLTGQPVTTLNLADAFVEVFQRDPRVGYAGGFYKLLLDVEDGTELLRRLRPHSSKCGGAMRAPVLGLMTDNILCSDRAAWQASVTHATPRGMAAASAAALLTWLCRNNVHRQDLGHKIDLLMPGWGLGAVDGMGEVPQTTTDGIEVVHTAIKAIGANTTMTGILKRCVDIGGDTDTVAAIALAAASQSKHVEQDIPDHLIDGLENGPYGFDYLADLDARLEKHFSPEADEADKEGDDPDDDGLDEDILSFFNDTTAEEPDPEPEDEA